MKKILLPLALMGTMALPMVACDVEDPAGDATDTTTDTTPGETTGDTGPGDTTEPDKYFAVIVDDSQIFPTHRKVGGVQCTDPAASGCNPCATSSVGAHGADIDAIGLFDGNLLIGYLDVVDYEGGPLCDLAMNDPDQAKGAPNASLTDRFVSLGGGFLTGEFAGQAQIQTGDTIIVYEVGTKCANSQSCGGVDEGYEVFVAFDIDCVNEANYPYASCGIKLSDDAEGEATIPVSGF